MTKLEQEIWLIEEQLKSLERASKDGFFQYALLMKKYEKLTGKEWRREISHIRNSAQ